MPEVFNQIAESIANDAPSAALRIATITEIESGGERRAKTDSTGDAWLPRDAETTLAVGNRVWILQQGSVWLIGGRLVGGSAVPIGTIVPYAGSTPPEGWLLCYGTEVSRAEYAALYAVCGDTYGAGNGSTTFRLPNLLNRVPVGSGSANWRGQTGGAATVTLTTAQMPGHDHGSAGGHNHSMGFGNGRATVQSGSGIIVSNAGIVNTTWDGEHTHSWQGGGQAHENMPPFLSVPYIIRAY